MIRLIGIDVDGTLVGASGVVEPRVWHAAERARARGIRLVLCSGRPAFGSTVEYARRLDAEGWHVFQNGASIAHLASGRSRSTRLPADVVDSFVAWARGTGQLLELYSDDDYATESRSAWAQQHAEVLGVPFKTLPFESLRGPIVRAQWLLSSTEAERFMADAPAEVEVAPSTSPLMPDTQFIGVTHRGVDKGSAIRVVVEEYGLDLRDVMYIGDSGNDLSALRLVGHPIAMGNAEPVVLRAAKRSVRHVDEGGLVQALNLAIASI